jgi:hypothetical protein
MPDREKSLTYAKEALLDAYPLRESVQSVQSDINKVLDVVKKWGLDANVFLEDIFSVELSHSEG